ncbi:hypothetical protein HDU76_005761 [Blyttiomyces sp. JEL0837]|nr:hypothetical protein HDU76_005761 [Blyttiomyces sp. JEL0837]
MRFTAVLSSIAAAGILLLQGSNALHIASKPIDIKVMMESTYVRPNPHGKQNMTVSTFNAGAVRPVLNTGPPSQFSGATGTAIWSGQSAAIRFTAPSDVPPYGARLIQIQIVLHGGSRPSSARLSVVEDSGRNSPGDRVLETRVVEIPRSNGRLTVTAQSPGNLYLYPGELFWFVLEGNAYNVVDSFSWLDSERGLAWTSYRVRDFVNNKDDDEHDESDNNGKLKFDNEGDLGVMNDDDEWGGSQSPFGPWIVEKNPTASSTVVMVA